MNNIFRHKADYLPVLYICSIFALQLGMFFFIENILLLSVLALLLIPFLGPSLAFNHNHHHNQTFRQPWLNRLFETMLFFGSGATPFAWTIHHNIGHHRNYLDRDKDTLKWEDSEGKPKGRLQFGLYNALMMYPVVFRLGKEHPTVFKKFLRMFIISIVLLILLFMYNPVNAMIIILFPILAMLFFTADGEYPHHIGLTTEDQFLAARSVENRFYNTCYFNLGLHTAHHFKPSLHWSKLPELHETIVDQIPKHLISKKDRNLSDLAMRED